MNTKAEVGYVGSDTCRTCHSGHDASFRRTGMGRSMAVVDLQRAPADAVFDHSKSGRRYRVARSEGKLLHRESLLNGGPDEVILNEFPVKYAVGSGIHSFTYFVEVDGFLAESPISWFAARQSWGMSPGYDRDVHPGFERPIGENCLHCHAGRAEPVDGSPNRIRFQELAIGCERCHGPGSLHVARHTSKKDGEPALGEIDYTIVNPIHLSRSLAEAICQDCHLSSPASVQARGRKLDDFRPGLPVQDFRHDFRLETPGKTMTVVGHVEQMHQSRCYQGSKTFSCLTCHDPHHEPAAANRVAHYQKICLQCHGPQSCKVDPVVRGRKEPGNNCVNCHMPAAATDVAHVAFTHHRVGIHERDENAAAKVGPSFSSRLEPILDFSAVSEMDRTRSLGLGYLGAAEASPDPRLAGEFRSRAQALLTKARSAGLRDGVLDLNLANLHFELKKEGALELAQSAEALGGLTPRQHCAAEFLIAQSLARAGNHRQAMTKLRELAQLRRDAMQMILLADCQRALGDSGYVESLESAVAINPGLRQVHQHLAEIWRRRGNLVKADFHAKRAGK